MQLQPEGFLQFVHLGVRHPFGDEAHIAGGFVDEGGRLLAESSLSIKEIAYSVNFDDNAYFATVFLREAGMTPKEYRRKFRAR